MSELANNLRRPAVTRASAGFTIVETIFVLAIAGIILLIVLLAIPTLTRNSRNNQRRQDVQTILAAVSHYELTDSGNFPRNCGSPWPNCRNSFGATNDYFLRYVAGKLTYYTNNQVFVRHQAARSTPNPDPDSSLDNVYIYNYQKCQPNGSSTWQGAGYSDIVALYAVESGNSVVVPQCQQL